jgi:hypothetical protein
MQIESYFEGTKFVSRRALAKRLTDCQLRLKAYHRAELRTSDHRPVYAIFQATVREVDEARKEAIAKSILHEIRRSDPNAGIIDERVERGLQDGLGGLINEMTHCELSKAQAR